MEVHIFDIFELDIYEFIINIFRPLFHNCFSCVCNSLNFIRFSVGVKGRNG